MKFLNLVISMSTISVHIFQNIDGDCTQVTATPTIMSHGEVSLYLHKEFNSFFM